MHDEIDREEELREALLDLERARNHERVLRQQYQRMLRSLSSVAASSDKKRLLEDLTLQLRDVLGAAAVPLVAEHRVEDLGAREVLGELDVRDRDEGRARVSDLELQAVRGAALDAGLQAGDGLRARHGRRAARRRPRGSARPRGP